MKLLVAGGREFSDPFLAYTELAHYEGKATRVISGMERGADRYGEEWAEDMGIPVMYYPADWQTHGKKAGYLRNVEMGDACDEAIIFWDGMSKGTKNMIEIMQKLGKPCKVIMYQGDEQ